jgi:ectoine hydroxylase-related dioxygenase (phytanoyl-CoA dioxygenase family)
MQIPCGHASIALTELSTESGMEDNSDRDIVEFERDGAFVLRGVLDAHWIEAMRGGIEIALLDREAIFRERAAPNQGRFHNGFFHWTRNRYFRDFLFNSELAGVAARFMRARQVNLFYDQLFVKEPKTPVETPWHSDKTYFPIAGGKLISIWVPFDPISTGNGAVSFIKGSHRWPDLNERIAEIDERGMRSEQYQMLTWNLEPGDLLLFDLSTIHGSGGNQSRSRRRALSTRWVNQDARYCPFKDDLFALLRKQNPNTPAVDIDAGHPFDSSLFPRVWPRNENDAK